MITKLKGPIGPHGPGTQSALYKIEMEPPDPPIQITSMSCEVHPDYDSLPEGIKIAFSPRDYFVMPDEEKRTLLFDIMNPEVEED
jgi:hypothetical protein